MESELQTQLNALRLQYELAPRFDVALEGRRLSQEGTGSGSPCMVNFDGILC